jgi:DNA-binding LacI/PurR family transcriptional regulator
LHPHLSLVRQLAYRIGHEAARLRIDCLGGRKASRHIAMVAELVEHDGIQPTSVIALRSV